MIVLVNFKTGFPGWISDPALAALNREPTVRWVMALDPAKHDYAGCLCVRLFPNTGTFSASGPFIEICMLAVAPEYRMQGVARSLLKHTLDRKEEFERIVLESLPTPSTVNGWCACIEPSNQASRSLFHKLDFEPVSGQTVIRAAASHDVMLLPN